MKRANLKRDKIEKEKSDKPVPKRNQLKMVVLFIEKPETGHKGQF